MNKNLSKIITIILFMLISGINIYANDAVFNGQGDSVFPINETKIEMVAENILITYTEADWKIECKYFFHNTGEDTEVLVGFPDILGFSGKPEGPNWYCIEDFETFVDGKKADIEKKKGISNPDIPDKSYPRVFTYKVTFKKDQKRIVTHSYKLGLNKSFHGISFAYILKTGALWKGTISRADITVKIDTGYLSELFPAGYKMTDDTLEWHFRDFEPAEDIKIYVSIYLKDWVKTVRAYLRDPGNYDDSLIGRPLRQMDNMWLEGGDPDLSPDVDIVESLLDAGVKASDRAYILPKCRYEGDTDGFKGNPTIARILTQLLKKYKYKDDFLKTFQYRETIYLLTGDKVELAKLYRKCIEEVSKQGVEKLNVRYKYSDQNPLETSYWRSKYYLNDDTLAHDFEKIVPIIKLL